MNQNLKLDLLKITFFVLFCFNIIKNNRLNWMVKHLIEDKHIQASK